MGRSASASMFWGFQLPEDLQPELELSKGSWWSDEHIALQHGVPRVPFVAKDVDETGYVAWSENYAQIRAVVEAAPGFFIYSGYMDSDFTPCYVGMKCSHWRCPWYGPEKRETLPVWEPGWEVLLRAFCEKMEIPWETPSWLLIASYG